MLSNETDGDGLKPWIYIWFRMVRLLKQPAKTSSYTSMIVTFVDAFSHSGIGGHVLLDHQYKKDGSISNDVGYICVVKSESRCGTMTS